MALGGMKRIVRSGHGVNYGGGGDDMRIWSGRHVVMGLCRAVRRGEGIGFEMGRGRGNALWFVVCVVRCRVLWMGE